MQPLNHAAEAEAGLRLYADVANKWRRKRDAQSYNRLADTIKKAVHFQLPEGGKIFGDNLKGIAGKGKDLEIPFPVITVSYDVGEEVKGIDSPYQTMISRKRCAVAWDHEGKIYMVSVFEDATLKNGWRPAMIGAAFEKSKWQPNPEDEFVMAPSKNAINEHKPRTLFHPLIILPDELELRAKLVGEQQAAQMGVDDNDDIWSVFELIEALHCTNVRQSVVQNNDVVLNARRRRMKKLPLYEVRALVIEAPVEKAVKGVPLGGTHASPKEHLRRAHYRKLADGRMVKVRSTTVNPVSPDGVVDKTYVVVK